MIRTSTRRWIAASPAWIASRNSLDGKGYSTEMSTVLVAVAISAWIAARRFSAAGT